MKEQGIEEIFKSALHNFEADVDPNVWTNVQSRISGTPASPAQSTPHGSIAGKAGAVAAKLGIKGVIAIVTAATGVSVGTYFLVRDTQDKKVVSSTMQTQQPVMQVSPEQHITITDAQVQSGTGVPNVAPLVNKIAPEPKVSEEKKPVIASS